MSVLYPSSNSSAVAPGDYTTTGGTLTFQPGTTVRHITVPVVGDSAVEGNESFTISLSGAINAWIGDSRAFGTIYDDDGTRQLVINDATMVEGDSGPTGLVFTVTLSEAALADVTVTYATKIGRASCREGETTTDGTGTFKQGTAVQAVTGQGGRVC